MVLYFDGNRLCSCDLETLDTKVEFELPPDREPIGQNAVSADGEWFFYVDAPCGSEYRKPCMGAKVVAWNAARGEHRDLFSVDAPIHHIVPYGDRHIVVNHPPGKLGMMLASMDEGGFSVLREGDPGAEGQVVHQVATLRGLAYETFYHPAGAVTGLYDPFTRARLEFCLPAHFGYTHTGWDPEGRFWFWEQNNVSREKIREGASSASSLEGHTLVYLDRLKIGKEAVFKSLFGNWPIDMGGQRAHFHPQLLPGGEWILFTGGDEHLRPQLFLLDVSDLKALNPIEDGLLSVDGRNDFYKPGRFDA